MKYHHYSVCGRSVAAAVSLFSLLSVFGTCFAADFKISGQVNRAITAADNGAKSDVGFVDSSAGNSKFRFIGSEDLTANTKIGLTYEIGLTDRTSAEWDVKNNRTPRGGNDAFVDNRFANIWLEGLYGRLTFGKLGSTSWGTSTLDYTGTIGMGGGIDITDWAAGLSFVGSSSDYRKRATNVSIGDVMNHFNGLYRQNGLTYNSPGFNGFSVSAGVYDGHAFDIAPKYETEFGDGGKFGITLGYLDTQQLGSSYTPDGRRISTAHYKEYGGSSALLLPNGINFSVAYKHRNYDLGTNPTLYHAGVGYRTGKHHVSVDYTQMKNFLMSGTEMKRELPNFAQDILSNSKSKFQGYGLAYSYSLLESIDLYASYHVYKLSNLTTTESNLKLHDINQLYAGAVIRFL